MADVLIRGMEKPRHCLRCPLRDKGDDHCVLQPESVETESWEFQMEHCPIVHLPEGHGRLIDADALGDFPYNISFCDEGDVENWIASALTVVPAEGGADVE